MHSDVDKLPERTGDPQTRAIVQRLRDLPDGFQPPYDWAEFQRRAAARHSHTPGQQRRYAAIAAGFAVLVGGVALWSRFGVGGAADVPLYNEREAVSFDAAVPTEAEVTTRDWLDRWEEPVIVRVGSRMATAQIEDRIACVDDLLSVERVDASRSERVIQLQRERDRLEHSLVQLRYAETLTAGLP